MIRQTINANIDKIKRIRLENGLTRLDIENKYGIKHDYLDRIERGVQKPSLVWLCRYAAIFNLNVVDLII